MKLTENAEDILEAIYLISKEKKVVRVKDVANLLKTSNASVTMALKSLSQKGLINHEHYGFIELTEKGKEIAEKIYERHKLLYEFLHETLALPAEIAEQDACRIEHYLSEEGLERIVKFIEFIKKCPEGSPIWLTNFYYFLEYEKYPERCYEKKEDMKTLSEMKIKEEGIIVKLSGSAATKQKLIKKDFVPGNNIKLLQKEKDKVIVQLGERKEDIPSELSKHIYVSLKKAV